MESCKEFVRELKVSDREENCRAVRSLTDRRIVLYLIEWRAVRSLLDNCKVSDRVRAVRSLLGEL